MQKKIQARDVTKEKNSLIFLLWNILLTINAQFD